MNQAASIQPQTLLDLPLLGEDLSTRAQLAKAFANSEEKGWAIANWYVSRLTDSKLSLKDFECRQFAYQDDNQQWQKAAILVSTQKDQTPILCEWADNYYSGQMSPQAILICAQLFTLSNLSFDEVDCAELFYAIRDWAYEQHPEAEQMIRALD